LAGIYDPTRGVVAPFGPASEALIARWCGATSIAQVALTRSASPALPAPEQWEALTRSLAAQPAPVLS
jgi:hypothetical protein